MTGSGGDDEQSRRDWLRLGSRAALGVSGVALAVPAVRYLSPPPAPTAPESPSTRVVCELSELEHDGARTVSLGGRPVIVLHRDDGIRAFDAVCTHLGCTVRFDATRGVLHCACHGADFDLESGAPLRGPATRPLARIPVQVRHGRVIIGA